MLVILHNIIKQANPKSSGKHTGTVSSWSVNISYKATYSANWRNPYWDPTVTTTTTNIDASSNVYIVDV